MLINTLRRPLVERQYFDPTNEEHLASMDCFLRTGNWGAVQFYPELPFIEVPATVLTKFACHQRGVALETDIERAGRLATKELVPAVAPETRIERRRRLNAANAKITAQLAHQQQTEIASRLRAAEEEAELAAELQPA